MAEVNLSGTCKWAKVRVPDDAFGDPKYSINLYPDAASLALFELQGLKNKFKEDEDGRFLTFRRDHNAKAFNGKTVFKGGPPAIVNPDGTPFDDTKFIGNGSTVTVKLEVYNTKKYGKASRISKIRVDNLIEFIPENNVVEAAVPF